MKASVVGGFMSGEGGALVLCKSAQRVGLQVTCGKLSTETISRAIVRNFIKQAFLHYPIKEIIIQSQKGQNVC